MIHFDWPWIALILPLPWFIRRFLSAINAQKEAALCVPSSQIHSLPRSIPSSKKSSKAILIVATLAWILLVTATTRPQWMGAPVELPISGRDLLMAVDLSGSMEMEDFKLNGTMVDRLTATKYVAGRFIQRRKGDRLGLILFGRNAYLQTPLTFDRKTVQTLLEEAVIGLAGKETAIGDAIGLAVKKSKDRPQENRVLVLLTDGANTAGQVSPLKAAQLAASEKLKIYTIGIGADEMMVRSFFGSRRVNPSADLDEKTLTEIATLTGGRYFRARDTDELETIYQLLDQLEPIEEETQSFRPTRSLFFWPLSLSLLLGSLLLFQMGRRSG